MLWKRGDHKLKSQINGSSGELKISTACYTFYHWLSPVIKSVRKQYPNLEINLVSEAAYRLEEFFKEGKLDVALTHYQPDSKYLQSYEMFEDELMLVVHEDHPLANKKHVDIEDLKDIHYLSYQTDLAKSITYQQIFKANNIAPTKISKVHLTEAIIEMIKADLGVSILSNWAIQPHLEKGGIRALSITKKKFKRSWWASVLKQEQIPQTIEVFINSFDQLEL